MNQPIHHNPARQIPLGMRPGRRELNEASLLVSMCDAVPSHMREKTREITQVHCALPARRQRLATMLLNFTCQEADANGITLLLTARPCDDEGPPQEVLVRWYSKFGFRALQDSPLGLLMARQVLPRAAPLRIVSVADAVSNVLHFPAH